MGSIREVVDFAKKNNIEQIVFEKSGDNRYAIVNNYFVFCKHKVRDENIEIEEGKHAYNIKDIEKPVKTTSRISIGKEDVTFIRENKKFKARSVEIDKTDIDVDKAIQDIKEQLKVGNTIVLEDITDIKDFLSILPRGSVVKVRLSEDGLHIEHKDDNMESEMKINREDVFDYKYTKDEEALFDRDLLLSVFSTIKLADRVKISVSYEKPILIVVEYDDKEDTEYIVAPQAYD